MIMMQRLLRPSVTRRLSSSSSTNESRLRDLLDRRGEPSLPPPAVPAGLYVPTVTHTDLMYVSGHPPLDVQGDRILGLCKTDDDVPHAKQAAAHVALAILATLRHQLGSLNRVKRVVKSLGMVNCVQPFGSQPQVMNGYSEVMRDVFGPENGVGVRSAVGMVLPNQISVEVEAVFELYPAAEVPPAAEGGPNLFAPTSESAVACQVLVDNAVQLIEDKGSTSAFSDMKVPGSVWCQGSTYLFAYDMDCNVVFNAAAPEKEGTNVGGHPDTEGKLFHDAFVAVAQSSAKQGWVDYQWPKPGHTEPTKKWTYARAVTVNGKEAVLMSGFYHEG